VRGDIYSAGAVLYEMATGRRPFPQTQGPQLMGAILHELPAAPSTLNPQISPGLENGIMKTLEKMPSRRYQSALELQAFLESLTAAVPPGDAHLSAVSEMPFQRTARVEPVARRKLLVGGLLISVLLLAGLLIALNVKGWRDRLMPGVAPNGGSSIPVSTAIKARPSVAVLGFKNVSGRPEEAWLSTALSEMLTTELAVGEQLRTVPGENVARMKIDLSLPDADTYGKETLANIRKNLGTDAVVLGSYVPLEKGQLRLDLRLQNTAAGETMAAVSEKGTEEQLDDLVSRAGVALRRKLGAGAVSDADAASVRAALPSNTEAARLYAEGLAKLRLFDNLAARDLLEKAVAIEPTHALSHSSLAAAWAGLGYDTNAAAEAKRAFDLSQGLSRQDHLSVEGRYRETTREWDKAVEIYKTLFGFFPDNLDYGLALAQSQTRAGNGTAALATVETLRKIPAPQNGDPRIDLAEAIAAQSLSDYTHESKAAARAAEKGQATGARLLLARARLFQSVALRQLGQPKDARAAIEDARQIFAASGDRNGVASADNGIANILSDQGDIQGAKKRFESALAIYREIGNKAGAGKVLGNLATEVSNGGDMAGGRKLCEEALVLLQESGDKNRHRERAKQSCHLSHLAGRSRRCGRSLQAVAETQEGNRR
jgi:tetratricopeptide (TPR) repeat protein